MNRGISVSWFVLILVAANVVLYHYPLALFSLTNLEYSSLNGVRTLATLLVIVVAVSTVFLSIIAFISTRLLKIFSAIAAVCNSISLYFLATYQVILDKSMMGNILNTQTGESVEFLHPKLILYVVLVGIIPVIFILKANIQPIKRIRTLITIVIAIVVMFTTIYINGSTALWFDQHSKKLGGLILPWSYIINTIRLQADRSRENVEVDLLPAPTSQTEQRSLVVLIIGETARAHNFSLYGYDRDTNPLLSSSGAIALQNSTACTTYTTASIHCMLTHNGATRGPDEPLPSYLHRHGVDVIWRTNNWGEPPIEVTQYTKSPELRESCNTSYCDHDEVLLTGLVDRVNASDNDKVFMVLHTKGSHGPAYHKRYPEAFATFKPECKSVELNKCTKSELINAYDNTIIYTDYFINSVIKELERISDRHTTMLYVSDHGESLGEYGLFLHGTPNAIAPAFQLEIPFIVWMSENFKQLNNADTSLFTREQYGHDNIFHSVLGALGISSTIYNQSLDIFQAEDAQQ